MRAQRQHATARLLQQLQIPDGWALAVTGSCGRAEMTNYSDIDLVILIPDSAPDADISAAVDEILYPLWDAKVKVDHSVRTTAQCLQVMDEDTTAALALLELTHMAGSHELVEHARASILKHWRTILPRTFDEVLDSAIARWRRSGSVVAMTRPDIKNGRGGLRDLALIRALALGQVCDIPPLDTEHRLLLDSRTLLHESIRRRRDILDPEYAIDVALALDYPDRYALSRALALAARTIDQALTNALGQARAILRRTSPQRHTQRRPLDTDVVEIGGTIGLSRTPNLSDPGLVLRVAAASARTGLPISPTALSQLRSVPPLPPQWPKAAVSDFIATLASPAYTHHVVRTLDDAGLWAPIVNEWDHIRGLMPREPSHIHTVDHHTLDTLARLGHNTVGVARPDLLLLAALYHDIGKGYDRPHEQVGAEQVARMAARMGLNPRDIMIVQTLVAEHTLLARMAATIDPNDQDAIDQVLDAVHYNPLILDLLEVLAEADAQATGPTVWTHRLARHVFTLCANARRHMTHLPPARPYVVAPNDLGLSRIDGGYNIHWAGDYPRESVRVLALIAAKGLTISAARMVNHHEPDGTTKACMAEFEVRGAVGTLDEAEFIQAYKSGVFSMLPPTTPVPVNTVWHGNTIEVRAVDQKALLGAVIGLLPDFNWLSMTTTGATMIATAHLAGGFQRAQVERDMARLSN
ncbi:protein-PII uridylyltransferase [Corynebacterium aquilae DSM 44791]|uniref:Protein-PII uridylyltransferase n=1 Tax=Corynebacterium aquilae DSM 44791 TaxID=1431546 RepID=A0A1L7CGN2_9CORY|nr:protein-PII uridylyltransferase [Corynebacterium aquilae DSM 44791]